MWTAQWYVGPFYATYVQMRLLANAHAGRADARAALDRATAALLFGQRDSGAWSCHEAPRAIDERSESGGRGPAGSAGGEGVHPRSIDTAHAVLALVAAQPLAAAADDATRGAVIRGLVALNQSRLSDGGWPSDEFIRMDCGRASGTPGRILSFGCRSLTTAYALKAAAVARLAGYVDSTATTTNKNRRQEVST